MSLWLVEETGEGGRERERNFNYDISYEIVEFLFIYYINDPIHKDYD